MSMRILLKSILKETLQLDEQVDDFEDDTPLFGSLPEFDSMAVVTIITSIEESIDCVIEDEEITAEIFETFGSLLEFLEEKAAG